MRPLLIAAIILLILATIGTMVVMLWPGAERATALPSPAMRFAANGLPVGDRKVEERSVPGYQLVIGMRHEGAALVVDAVVRADEGMGPPKLVEAVIDDPAYKQPEAGAPLAGPQPTWTWSFPGVQTGTRIGVRVTDPEGNTGDLSVTVP